VPPSAHGCKTEDGAPSTASSNKRKRAEEDLPTALPDSVPPYSTAGNVAASDSANAEDSSALEESSVAAAAPRRHHLAPSRLKLEVTAHPTSYCP
jgi:hypothetical protein